MSNRDNQASHATMVPGVDEHKRLLLRFRQHPSKNRLTGRVGTETPDRSPLPTENELERDASFLIFADQVATEGRPTDAAFAPVVPLTSEQQLVRDAVTGILVHFEKALNKLALETLTVSQKMSKIAYQQPWSP